MTNAKDAAMTILSELKRRNVIPMAGLYLVRTWRVVQRERASE
jgi:hypothetical protein